MLLLFVLLKYNLIIHCNFQGQRRIRHLYKIFSLDIHPDGNHSEQGSVSQWNSSEVNDQEHCNSGNRFIESRGLRIGIIFGGDKQRFAPFYIKILIKSPALLC